MITVLSGGTGTPKLLKGLLRVIPQRDLTIIANTADDIELYGLYISPDVDTIIYLLAGLLDEEKWWGIRGDTFHFVEMMRRYGEEAWFNLGDRDLAIHVIRTRLLRRGWKLSEVIKKICSSLSIEATILPMTDDRVETRIITSDGRNIHFQEFWVKYRGNICIKDVIFSGIEKARPADGVIDAIESSKGVIIGPSNPITSIGPIVSIKGIREALRDKSPVIAISPIVGNKPVSGPAAQLMKAKGVEVSSLGVAELYSDFLDIFIIDKRDQNLKDEIEGLGIKVIVADTIMDNDEKRMRLALITLKAMGVEI
ncbi:MAG: 2-phospho-L-lactate transferase [Candidatus Baldrarchaeia archaeon]